MARSAHYGSDLTGWSFPYNPPYGNLTTSGGWFVAGSGTYHGQVSHGITTTGDWQLSFLVESSTDPNNVVILITSAALNGYYMAFGTNLSARPVTGGTPGTVFATAARVAGAYAAAFIEITYTASTDTFDLYEDGVLRASGTNSTYEATGKTAMTVLATGASTRLQYLTVQDYIAVLGVPYIAATGNAALGGMTNTASATVTAGATEHFAVAAAALGGLTATAAATVSHVVVANAALGALTGTVASTTTRAATGNAALGGLTGTAAATTTRAVTANAALGGLTATAAAAPDRAAVANAALGGLAATAAATPDHPAVANAALGAITATASATVTAGTGEIFATADGALGTLASTATATVTHTVTANAALGAITATVTATVTRTATAVASLGGITATVSATTTRTATATATLPGITGTAAATVTRAATGNAALGAIGASATATVNHAAVLAAALGALTALAVASSAAPAEFDVGELTITDTSPLIALAVALADCTITDTAPTVAITYSEDPMDYDIGDAPEVTGTFTTSAGVLTDPTTVVVKVHEPDGTETTYTSPNAAITNPSTGVWLFTFPAPIDAAGEWYVRISGTAGLVAAGERVLRVRQSAFATP